MYAAGELGVRLDVPYRSLTEHERDIVLHGEPVKRQVTLQSGRNGRSVRLSVNYDNAVAAVERSLRSDNERTRRLVQRFLVTRVCSVCHGTRLRPEALASRLGGRNLDHDLDLLAAADHLIDMGPGGGPDGGHILAAGKPADVARAPGSATGPWLAGHTSRGTGGLRGSGPRTRVLTRDLTGATHRPGARS